MTNIEDAISKIKVLECPTGDIKSRIKEILKDHEIANGTEITVNRNHMLDKNGAHGYSADITCGDGPSIHVLAASGMDDYVVKVIDVSIN